MGCVDDSVVPPPSPPPIYPLVVVASTLNTRKDTEEELTGRFNRREERIWNSKVCPDPHAQGNNFWEHQQGGGRRLHLLCPSSSFSSSLVLLGALLTILRLGILS